MTNAERSAIREHNARCDKWNRDKDALEEAHNKRHETLIAESVDGASTVYNLHQNRDRFFANHKRHEQEIADFLAANPHPNPADTTIQIARTIDGTDFRISGDQLWAEYRSIRARVMNFLRFAPSIETDPRLQPAADPGIGIQQIRLWVRDTMSFTDETIKLEEDEWKQYHPNPPEAQYCLYQRGANWVIQYRQESAHVAHLDGLEYIHHLLDAPDKDISAFLLAGKTPPTTPYQEEMDAKALEDAENEIERLEDDARFFRGRGEEGKAKEKESKIEEIRAHISASKGLGGRPRNLDRESENVRVSVTKAIKLAFEKLPEYGCPELAEHLKKTIRTGSHCKYISTGIPWKLTK